MKKWIYLSLAFFIIGCNKQKSVVVTQTEAQGGLVKVEMKTNKGVIQMELDSSKAPITVANFVDYAKSGFYNGTIFHRVIDGFMIQGGGFDSKMNQKTTKSPIKNEASNGLPNKALSIAMARTNNPDSATAQFFINLVDNSNLDARPGQAGYAVFGRVVAGEEVVKAIAKTPTHSVGYYDDVPAEPVIIESVTVQ